MTADDYVKSLLAIVIWRESRGDGVDAMRAVAHVIANRVKDYWKDKATAWDWITVITSANQFSSMTIRGDSQTVLWPPLVTDWPNSHFDIAERVYRGQDLDNTAGALFYANEANITSGWYKTNIIDSGKHPVLITIGKQTFRA